MLMRNVQDGDIEAIHRAAGRLALALGQSEDLLLSMDEIARRVERNPVAGLLRDMSLVQIDDRPEVLETHALEIAIATAGRCSQILAHSDDTPESIARKLQAQDPTAVTLMDGTMYGVRGFEVIPLARSARHFGYSDDPRPETRQAFLDAGAIEVFRKNAMQDFRFAVQRISQLLES